MKKNNLSSLNNLLGGALARHGIGERVVAAQIVASANELLTEMLVPEQRGEVKAVSYKDSQLLLACRTPTSRYVVEGLVKALGRKLEEQYPNKTFRQVICRLQQSGPSDEEWYNGSSV